MNAYLPFDSAALWQLAGWTMVHFLWLGAAAAALSLLWRFVLRNAAPNIRYAAALTCLLLLAAMPIAIATWLAMETSPPLKVEDSPWRRGVRGGMENASPKVVASTIKQPEIIELNKHRTPELAPPPTNVANEIVTNSTPTPAKLPTNHKQTATPISFAALQRFVPYLPWLWLIGTPITFALLTIGVVGTKRLRQSSRTIDDVRLTDLLKRACTALNIRARVGLAVCDRIATPVLIGILRPMILLPPAALTGWSPDEIEMVLLHELAHVRRWDNLVNLLQRCIESLLFFHPAVWIISTWVRREREDCCDAIVVRRTERPHAYAELLVALAAQLPRSVLFHPVASSAMSSGPLHTRIRRILQLESDPMLISGKSFAILLASILVAATFTVFYVPTIGQAEESTNGSFPVDGVKLASLEREIADDPDKFATAHLPYAVEFEQGADRFRKGDSITILDIRGTSRTFEPGNVYQIKGKYTLASHDRARLCAFTTAKKAADGTGPVWEIQATNVNRGEGTFTLFLPMKHDGWPHVSFYPAGTAANTFGGIYFGTGDSVLKKWWKDGDVIDKTSSTELRASDLPISNDEGSATISIDGEQLQPTAPNDAALPIDAAGPTIPSNPLSILNDKEAVKALFQTSDDNPLLRIKYPVPGALHRNLNANLEGWKSDPFGPRLDFDAKWDKENNSVLVSAPKAAQEKLFRELFKQATANVVTVKDDGTVELHGDATIELAPAPEQTSSSSDDWLKEAHLKPEEFEIAKRAWKELGVKFVTASDEELQHIRRGGTKGGLKALALEDSLNVKSPVIFTHFQSRALSTGIPNFASLNKALDALTSGRHGEMVVLQGMNKGGGLIQYSIRWPLGSNEPNGLQRDKNPSSALGPAGLEVGQTPTDDPTAGYAIDAPSHPKFPSLEDQKLADLAFKRLGLELEPINDAELETVKKFGYDGGLRVAGRPSSVAKTGADPAGDSIVTGDLLVGLHAWPTTSLAEVAKVLQRDDIAELSPLKFYVIRIGAPQIDGTSFPGPSEDTLITGRIAVQRDRTPNPQSLLEAMQQQSNSTGQSIPRDLYYYQDKKADNSEQSRNEPASQSSATDEETGTIGRRTWNDYSSTDRPPFALLSADEPERAIYFFHSQNSAPCQKMKPIIDRLAKEWLPVPVIQVEVGQNPGLAATMNVDAVPSVVVLGKSGRVLRRLVGLQNENELDEAVRSAVSPSAETATQQPPSSSATNAPSYVLPSPDDEDTRPKSRRVLPTAPRSDSDDIAEERPNTRRPTRVPTASTSKESLRYDDKTFEQWRDLWKNELSTTKRTEAIKALAAFARAGYGEEATETILDVAGEYDFLYLSSVKETPVQKAVVDELAPGSGDDSLAKYWVPELTARLKQEPDRWKWLAYQSLGRLRTDDADLLPILHSLAAEGPSEVRSAALTAVLESNKWHNKGQLVLDDKTRNLLAEALKSNDGQIIWGNIGQLIRHESSGEGGGKLEPVLIFQPELVPLLLQEDENLQRHIRGIIQHIAADDAPKVVDQLVNKLKDDSQTLEQRLAAIRALAAIGNKAQAAIPEFQNLVTPATDEKTLIALLFAIQRIAEKPEELPLVFDLLTQNVNDDQKEAVRQKVERDNISKSLAKESEAVLPPNQYLGGGGGFF